MRRIFARQKGQIKKRSVSSSVMGAPHWVQRCSTVHEPPIIVRVFHRTGCSIRMLGDSLSHNDSIFLPLVSSRTPDHTSGKKVQLVVSSFRILGTGRRQESDDRKRDRILHHAQQLYHSQGKHPACPQPILPGRLSVRLQTWQAS